MSLKLALNKIADSKLTEELANRINRETRLILGGGNLNARAIIASSIATYSNRNILIVVPTLEEASRWYSVIRSIGWERSYFYPTSEVSPYDSIEPTSEIIWGQLQVLCELCTPSDKSIAIVTTERALQPHLPPKEVFIKRIISLRKEDQLDLELLSENLASIGYERTVTTEQEGQWSRRGDIVDIYPVSLEFPIRIEIFGDQIDKIREFDPVTQRSLDEITTVSISPTSFNKILEYSVKNNPCLKSLSFLYNQENTDSLDQKSSEIRRYIGVIYDKPSSILNYIEPDSFVVNDEPIRCKSHSNVRSKKTIQSYLEFEQVFSQKKIPDLVLTNNLILDTNNTSSLISNFDGFDTTEFPNEYDSLNIFSIASKTIPSAPNQFSKLSLLIKDYKAQNYSIYIISAQPTRAVELLGEHDCSVSYVLNIKDLKNISYLNDRKVPIALKADNNLGLEGLNLAPWKILLITDKEIFGQHSISYSGYIRRRKGATSKSINANKLNQGDYVVHRNHGIGRFIRIEKFGINNENRDYLLVQYTDGTLRVAADQLGTLGRYRSTTEKSPKIDKLGGTSWTTAKERARKSIRKIALDLVKLYAEREKTSGYKFPKDGPWQKELEEAFQYEPTPDQLQAVIDIKKDMEKSKPMDRLICGDVGYGKTEVAIRALFKAIISGKQVAMLAPTTILSQQHWRTISDRFAPYPINVALLNRFKSNKEKNDIVRQLKEGSIDAIIGTHLLLSKKVEFKDLGLLIIDEEQRFGVRQKEKIKELKTNIDVITLSATPIPRTLYMSLSGVREMSLITTPPPLRRSIKTHLSQYDKEVIRSAICQEIDRGGQIFYVLPRIENIDKVLMSLKEMIPRIKVIVAHGQMLEGELENAMIAFNNGEADLMLCTTIIESGLDIPRVNTIVIEDSHKFGLSQLYQLRGRVGRSGVQAHAWLLYPEKQIITDIARKRLSAIQEFSELGSGYQLAMRDMEIRGVGNLIGIQQSGQMEAIGFDLFMEILNEAISDIQGEAIPKVDETKIDLPLTAFIPASWITNNDEKLAAYKAATECDSHEKLIELSLSWSDKYGSLPEPVSSLLELLQLKLLARSCGFSRISVSRPDIILDTKMSESTFKVLKSGLQKKLHSRAIYKNGNTISSVVFRGLGVLPASDQLTQVSNWISQLQTELNDLNG